MLVAHGISIDLKENSILVKHGNYARYFPNSYDEVQDASLNNTYYMIEYVMKDSEILISLETIMHLPSEVIKQFLFNIRSIEDKLVPVYFIGFKGVDKANNQPLLDLKKKYFVSANYFKDLSKDENSEAYKFSKYIENFEPEQTAITVSTAT